MRRADRLFQIVQKLRRGKLTTARDLAQWLEVSERTIYRDIADLMKSGLPIDGEAGLGYLMREGYDLPPLMFTEDEIVALRAGVEMVRAWGGTGMARARTARSTRSHPCCPTCCATGPRPAPSTPSRAPI